MNSTENAPSLPSIAIVGRPNVGKSSLFNAILGRRQAIVLSESGITRDRVVSSGVFEGRRFSLIDTGGLGSYAGERRNVGFWDKAIAKQVEVAIESATTIIFVVDVQAGLQALDSEVATRLRASGKHILLAANKCDNEKLEGAVEDFKILGFGKIHLVSCLHRRGVKELMSEALQGVPRDDADASSVKRLRLAVVGRPNVGKSSLVNRLLGEERVIVSDIPGTTRDAIDIDFTLKCNDESVPAILVDTAGLRKRSKVEAAVEKFSVMRAEKAIEDCDITLFVVEAGEYGATSQDKTIARLVSESGKGCIIVANKWDACSGLKQRVIEEEFRRTLSQMAYAPIVFTCALSGLNFKALFEAIAQVRAQMSVKITTGMVNRVIGDALERNLPPVVGVKPFKIFYGTMLFTPPPTFALFVNDHLLCADQYRSYLEKYFRTAFSFVGFPIRLILKDRPRLKKGEKGPKTLALEEQLKLAEAQMLEDTLEDGIPAAERAASAKVPERSRTTTVPKRQVKPERKFKMYRKRVRRR